MSHWPSRARALVLAGLMLASPCTTTAVRRLAEDASLSGGAEGRGWGGASATECGLGVLTQHPTALGFRITMTSWAKGATLKWHFDTPVKLQKHWGPVRALPQDNDSDATLAFRLKGEKLPSLRRNRTHAHRTDQWGFVLTESYSGRWRQSCTVPSPPPALALDTRGTADESVSSTIATTVAPPPPVASQSTPLGVSSWLASVGLGKLSAAATAAVGLVSASGSTERTPTADSDDNGGRVPNKRGNGRGRRGGRGRRRRQKKHRHG